MYFNWQNLRRATAGVLILLFTAPSAVLAETHLVNQTELQHQMLTFSQSRRQNLQAVEEFLSLPQAQKALRELGTNQQQVKTAVAGLSDAELANLAVRAQKTQADFAAGTLTNHDLILIILGMVALILIIVAVR